MQAVQQDNAVNARNNAQHHIFIKNRRHLGAQHHTVFAGEINPAYQIPEAAGQVFGKLGGHIDNQSPVGGNLLAGIIQDLDPDPGLHPQENHKYRQGQIKKTLGMQEIVHNVHRPHFEVNHNKIDSGQENHNLQYVQKPFLHNRILSLYEREPFRRLQSNIIIVHIFIFPRNEACSAHSAPQQGKIALISTIVPKNPPSKPFISVLGQGEKGDFAAS
ncbi:hypothetical protein D3C75_735670 [compost metagenome]